MDEFIRDQNIAEFVERLHIESDDHRRHTLQRLLIEEEDKFARASEKVEQLDRLIDQGRGRIAKLRDLQSLNGSTPLGERLLRYSNDLVCILRRLRHQFEREIDSTGL